jgi:tetratricopeptide (TPR) repeat protein
MQLAEQDSFVQLLLEQPYDDALLESVHTAMGKDPRAYAALLVRAAEHTKEHVPASHWLTEAARVQMHALNDERDSVRLLEAALERDPLNLRAAEHMVELYRNSSEDREFAQLLKSRADRMRQRSRSDPVPLPHAVIAFEKLSDVYEAIGDSSCAIEALRTALEIERTRARSTAPSPPPEGPPDSVFRTRAADSFHVGEAGAVAPERRRRADSSRAPRDTIRSPVPPADSMVADPGQAQEPSESRRTTRPPSLAPVTTPPAAIEPLLLVIEALHALRRVDDVVEGAALVLKTALAAVPSASGFVHITDVGTRDFVVVAAAGRHNAEVIGTRTPDTDELLLRAADMMDAVLMEVTSATELVGSRWGVVRPERALLSAPAQFDGRYLGAIELVDPDRTNAYSDADRHAVTYVGERFAEFLADRSLAF